MKIANVFPLIGVKKQFRQKHFDQYNMLNVALQTKGTAYKMRNNDAFFKKIRLLLSDMQHSTLSILSLIITNSILVHSCRLSVTRIHLNHRIKYLNWHHHSIVHARISLFNTAFVVFFSLHAEESKRVIWRCFALILVSLPVNSGQLSWLQR